MILSTFATLSAFVNRPLTSGHNAWKRFSKSLSRANSCSCLGPFEFCQLLLSSVVSRVGAYHHECLPNLG